MASVGFPCLWRTYWFDLGGGVVPTSFSSQFHYAMRNNSNQFDDFDKYNEPRLHMERLLKARLIEFNLSLRILCPLEAAGINTLGDLIKHSKKSLRKFHQLGRISVETLETFLRYHGLELAQ